MRIVSGDDRLDLDELARSIVSALGDAAPKILSIATVALSFVSDDEIRELNAKYRGVDEPTDVLSFPMWEEDGAFVPPDGWEELPLGDVVVSVERVRADALAIGSTEERELPLIAAHGALHLIGYDHDTDARRDEMWKIQEAARDHYLQNVLRKERGAEKI